MRLCAPRTFFAKVGWIQRVFVETLLATVPPPRGGGAAGGAAASRVSTDDLARFLNGESSNDIWELWLAASKTSYIVSQCIATTEPAYLAKHTFQLAQLFNTFYHRYPILSEADQARKKFLLATAAVVRRELIRVLAAMGISVPPVM